jgi:tetratricopeptide (TPR) repeat protein
MRVCLFPRVQSTTAHTSDQADAARELIHATSLVNILRTDAEQASQIADRLPEDLPKELSSQFRSAIDQNLAYDKMEAALIKSVAASVDLATLENSLRWWASDSGRAVAKAESSAYAELFPGSTFQGYNPNSTASRDLNATELAELMGTGGFPQFIADLLTATETSRMCLYSSFNIGPDCARGKPVTDSAGRAQRLQHVATAATHGYSRISSGDLSAYLAYLRLDSTRSTIQALHASLSAVEQDSWDNALTQASRAIDTYSRATFGSRGAATLKLVIADMDAGGDLVRAHMTLGLLRHAMPSDPAVLVQLARVTLMQGAVLGEVSQIARVPRVDAMSLDVAQYWLDQALAFDPHRAETLLIDAHVAYLKKDFKHSLELLKQAKTIGTTDPWLGIDMGDTLCALAQRRPGQPPDHDLTQQAADEFEVILNTRPTGIIEYRVVQQLGDIYAALGQLQKADSFQRRFVSYCVPDRQCHAYALQRYGGFLFYYMHDIDAAIVMGRQALELFDYGAGRKFLVGVLLAKAAKLYTAGELADSASYVAQAQQIDPDLAASCPALAGNESSLPVVFAIRAAGLLKDFSGSTGAQTLVSASRYATADEIKTLLGWGANPNYFDPEEGTALHQAIQFNNVAAAKTLLAHGANPLTPYVDGRTPRQMTEHPPEITRPELAALIAKAARDAGERAPLGTPLGAGYRYRMKKSVSGDRWGNDFVAGEQVIFVDNFCNFTDSSFACLNFKKMDDLTQMRNMALPKDQLAVWTDWFEELGPSAESKSDR